MILILHPVSDRVPFSRVHQIRVHDWMDVAAGHLNTVPAEARDQILGACDNFHEDPIREAEEHDCSRTSALTDAILQMDDFPLLHDDDPGSCTLTGTRRAGPGDGDRDWMAEAVVEVNAAEFAEVRPAGNGPGHRLVSGTKRHRVRSGCGTRSHEESIPHEVVMLVVAVIPAQQDGDRGEAGCTSADVVAVAGFRQGRKQTQQKHHQPKRRSAGRVKRQQQADCCRLSGDSAASSSLSDLLLLL